MIKQVLKELKGHFPFTIFGVVIGVTIMLFFQNVPPKLSHNIFYIFHPMHVVLSALVTASMYKFHKCGRSRSKCNIWILLAIGYAGSIGIATVSDSLIPYLGEALLDMPNRGLHLGFIEKWWLVNPLAILGAAVAYFTPTTKFPHAGHVVLSTWASLFHIIMAVGEPLGLLSYIAVLLFLFLAVWIPCCVSDIVFPLLCAGKLENASIEGGVKGFGGFQYL